MKFLFQEWLIFKFKCAMTLHDQLVQGFCSPNAKGIVELLYSGLLNHFSLR